MTILTALASAVARVADPLPAAVARLEQARAGLTTAEARKASGTAQSEARAKEREAYPHLRVESGPYVGPANAAGDEEVAAAKIALREAESAYDAHEPRVQSLRDRVRAVRRLFTALDKAPRNVAIREHLRALDELGVDADGAATAALQKPIADELAAIADELKALRAERRREGMPDPYLFSVRVTGDAGQLSLAIGKIGMGGGVEILAALRMIADAGVLTVEALDGAIAVLGTRPPPELTQEHIYLHHRKTAREHWTGIQQLRVKQDADRARGLRAN